ncbi:hypothetical protein LCGC14_2241280 [marine sediment metagenome]|uniref:Uncharacterized protein n=1 Tax=marine sediment metagenome TaxID=412755 RepID=A0A0F9D551_9ZZZZ
MSKEFIDYLDRNIQEKLEEDSYPILKEIKEDFSRRFPELTSSSWEITYKPIEKLIFEILIDTIKILAERRFEGHGTYITYKVSFKCTDCDKEIQEGITDIKAIHNALINKNKCIECQLKSK